LILKAGTVLQRGQRGGRSRSPRSHVAVSVRRHRPWRVDAETDKPARAGDCRGTPRDLPPSVRRKSRAWRKKGFESPMRLESVVGRAGGGGSGSGRAPRPRAQWVRFTSRGRGARARNSPSSKYQTCASRSTAQPYRCR
jgi:hypothetical protein